LGGFFCGKGGFWLKNWRERSQGCCFLLWHCVTVMKVGGMCHVPCLDENVHDAIVTVDSVMNHFRCTWYPTGPWLPWIIGSTVCESWSTKITK
jgi:hypothetical protein